MSWLARRRCRKHGHEWFPFVAPREFVPVTSRCLRCQERWVLLPWGECLNAHPIAEHYSSDGHVIPHDCRGPA